MRVILSVLLFLLPITNLFSAKPSDIFHVLPKPQKVEYLEGKGFAYNELKFIVCEDCENFPVLNGMLAGLPRMEVSQKGVYLRIVDKNVPESKEGYVLEVGKKGVHISSKSLAGLFYGCQTLEQLMEDSRDFGVQIPQMRITDYPDIAYRAIHLDTKHHLDRIEYYYDMIDRLAKYKVNAVIWELEDKFAYPRHPELGSPNAISKQEMQAICRYAAERNIDISPLIQSLGHAGYILKHHWELREDPNSDVVLCPSNPNTYDLIFDMYKDAIEAMPYGKYIHIGGDEVGDIGIDERCRKTGKSAFELQMEWLGKVSDFIKAKGRTPIFWDDVPLKYAGLWPQVLGDDSEEDVNGWWNIEKLDEAIGLFPKDCIYMRWNYGNATHPAHIKLIDWYREKGLPVMAATAASDGDCPFMPRNDTKLSDIQGFSKITEEYGLSGILATAWGDGSPHLETVWRGFIGHGEFGWNPNGRTVEEFIEVHAQREFGLEYGKGKMNFLKELEKAFFFFDGALIDKGWRNPAWFVGEFQLIDLPNAECPGLWSEVYKEKIGQAEIEQKRFEYIKSQLDIVKKEALRNRYTLEIYEQNNYLQNFPVRLILALRDYDLSESEGQRQDALKKISQVCDYFYTMRENLLDVYSKTRFMNQPEGYIEDSNYFKHLSAKRLNSDWLFLYEIPMVESVKKSFFL